MTTGPYNAPPSVARFQRRLLLAGILFAAILVVGFFWDRAQLFHSYLFAFSFWAGISVGSLALLMLQHLTGGGWGLVIRRVLEAATRTLPLVLILFVPIVSRGWCSTFSPRPRTARRSPLTTLLNRRRGLCKGNRPRSRNPRNRNLALTN